MHINLGKEVIPPITLGPYTLQTFKLLTITIDSGLTWWSHVGNIGSSFTYHLYLLKRHKSLCVHATELSPFYNLFILSKLVYASSWASSLTTTQLSQPERVQKSACNVIRGPSYTTYDVTLWSWPPIRLYTSPITPPSLWHKALEEPPLLSSRCNEKSKLFGNNQSQHRKIRA